MCAKANDNIRLPIRRRDQVLRQILDETGGRYESTVEALKDLVAKAWDLAEAEEEATEQSEEDYDY